MNSPQYETTSGKNVKIPRFVWKSVEKLESEQEYLETDGLYRVPGEDLKQVNIHISFLSLKTSRSKICTLPFLGF